MQKLISTQTRIADLGKPRVVIIGGGFGGLYVTKGFNNYKTQTVLIDKFNHHCFQPLLYQVATSGLESNSIVFPFRKRFSNQEDFFFRLGEVTRIVPEENHIETSIGHIKYDFLVIASGATTNYYGMNDVEENSLPMKTIIDSAITEFEAVDQMLAKEGKLKMEDKQMLKDTYDRLIIFYEQRKDEAKITAYTDKFNNVDRVH